MFLRFQRIRQIYEDPENACHRKVIDAGIERHGPQIETINRICMDKNARIEHSFRNIQGQMELPFFPLYTFVGFASKVGRAWNEIPNQERIDASLPPRFIKGTTRCFLFFCVGRYNPVVASFGILISQTIRQMEKRRDIEELLAVHKDGPGDRSSRLEAIGIDPQSVCIEGKSRTYRKHDGSSDCIVYTADCEGELEQLHRKITSNLAQIARRLCLGFNPDFLK